MGSIKWKMATLYMALVVTVMISSGVFILFTLQNNSYREVFRQNEYTAERIVDRIPMISVYLAPYRIRERMSLPRSSVPNRCPLDPGGRNALEGLI